MDKTQFIMFIAYTEKAITCFLTLKTFVLQKLSHNVVISIQ